VATGTRALESDAAVERLVRRAASKGCIEWSHVERVADQLGLDDDGRCELLALLDERGASVRDDCARQKPRRPSIANGSLAELTTDTLGLFLQEISRYPLLKPAEEVELAQRIEHDDEQAKEEMIVANLRLVVYWAKRYQHQGVALLDLIQEGIFGLIRAVEKFDWRKGFKFSTYASFWIRQSLQRAVQGQAREIRLPLELAERARRLQRAREVLHRQLDRDPTEDELAAESGLTIEQLAQLTEAARVVTSLDTPVGETGDATLGDLFSAEEQTEQVVHVSLEEEALRRAVDELGEPYRTIIRRRYGLEGEPMGQYRLGRELHMSDKKLRSLEREALANLALSRELANLDDGRAA
jgi:RNA polymerase primary sigma factor